MMIAIQPAFEASHTDKQGNHATYFLRIPNDLAFCFMTFLRPTPIFMKLRFARFSFYRNN